MTNANTFEAVSHNRFSAYLSSFERKAILKALGISDRVGTAADIGCDTGRWSELLSKMGWHVLCVDVNAEALEICKERIADAEVILVTSDAEAFPISNSSLDLIMIIQVEAVVNANWFVKEGCLCT